MSRQILGQHRQQVREPLEATYRTSRQKCMQWMQECFSGSQLGGLVTPGSAAPALPRVRSPFGPRRGRPPEPGAAHLQAAGGALVLILRQPGAHL